MLNRLIAFLLSMFVATAPAFAQAYTAQNTTLKNNLTITGVLTTSANPQKLANIENAVASKYLTIDIGANAALANSTTFISSAPVGRACKILNISCSAQVAPVGGVNTLAITKNNVTTLLSTANIDPTTLVSNTGKILTLTGTPANLVFAPTDTITVTWVSGVQGTACVGPSVTVELTPTVDY